MRLLIAMACAINEVNNFHSTSGYNMSTVHLSWDVISLIVTFCPFMVKGNIDTVSQYTRVV